MEESDDSRASETSNTIKIFKQGSMIILMLLLLVASFGFYFGMQNAIFDLFDYRYQQLLRSIFNLIVVVAVLYIVKLFFFKK